MANRPKHRATLAEMLESTSDVLFPEHLGEAPVMLDSVGCDGDTPLHVMVWRNDLYAVRTLLQAGSKVDAIGDMSETPLHVAVGQENTAIIEALLEAGARFDVRSEFGETAAERAARIGGEVAKVLARNRDT
jgi:ankyrin repeat protein